MQPHPEHQQDYADIGHLLRQSLVSDEAGRRWADQDTRQKVAQQRRKLQPAGNRAKYKGKAKPHGKKRTQWGVVRHRCGALLLLRNESNLRRSPILNAKKIARPLYLAAIFGEPPRGP